MRDYTARAKALVMKLDQNNVSTTKKEINRRILNGLPSEFDVEKKMFLLMTDTDPDELGEVLTRVDDSRTKNGGAGGAHALTTGAKSRGGGQGRGGGARRDRGGRGNARGRRDGKGQQHHHQQQWASMPVVQQHQKWASQPRAQQQQWASQPPAQQQQWALQPPAQQQQPQTHQRQPPQRQLQQQQRPPEHSGGWGPSRVCFRCGQPGHFYTECRAVPRHYTVLRSMVNRPTILRLLLEITRLLRKNTETKCPRRRPRKERRHLPIRPGASRPSGP